MGSVRKRTAKFLKDLFFIVFAVDLPMSKILEGEGFEYGQPSISTSVVSSSHPSSWSSILASLPVPSELASSSFSVSCKLRNSDKYVSSELFPGRYEMPVCFLFKLGCSGWRNLLRVGDVCVWIRDIRLAGVEWRVCEVGLERVILYCLGILPVFR